jgi:PAS domain S-box-containing protein
MVRERVIRPQPRQRVRVNRHRRRKTPNFSQDLLNCFPDFCFVLDGAGTILAVNERVGQKIGGQKAELLNKKFYQLLTVESRVAVAKAVRECLNGKASGKVETQLSVGDSWTDVVLYFSRYPSEKSSQKYCLLFARDIAEEKKKDLELLRFYNVAQNTVNPVEITDVNGRIVYVNPAYEKASGYTKAELIGKNPNIFGSGKHPKSFWEKMWRTILSGEVWVGKIENRRKDGQPFFTQLLISPIVGSGGKIVGFFGVHRDISEQKFLEEHLMQAQKLESIGTLAAGLAHEVGNPLTSISSLVQVLQRSTEDEFTREKLELIRHQITRISKIIRDLVDFSRPSKYEIKPTDINKSVEEALGIVKVGKKAKGVDFRLDLKENLPALPLVADQIEQVFINILLNALDAISEKGGSGETWQGEISVRTSMNEENVMVTIEDNGKGIPERDLSKVFEPFFTTKNLGEGTGLGLWVSYGIVKSFGGDLQVESQLGEGSKFTITLPIHTETA